MICSMWEDLSKPLDQIVAPCAWVVENLLIISFILFDDFVVMTLTIQINQARVSFP